MILADITIDGKLRHVLMQAPKNGFFYVLDRETGKLLSAKTYVDITWASGFDMKTGRPIVSPTADYEKEIKFIKPSPLGGHSWHPMSFSPKTGLVYIPVNDIPFPYRPQDKKFALDPVNFNTGVPTPIGALPRELAKGKLLAWDPVKQQEAWHVDYTGPWNGGALTTAGNLVFEGTADRRFVAYNATTGEKLWQFDSQSGIVAAPVTYAIDGEQYVAVMAGWGGVWALVGTNSAAATGNKRGTPGRVLVFKLGSSASLPPLPAFEPIPPALHPTADAAELLQGENLYHERCSICHGGAAVGGGVLPDLRHSLIARDKAIEDVVLKGALKANGMPDFSAVLTARDVALIQQYILQQGWLEQSPPHG
jgi:quinohemoprotein ethanol dehydrogenase